MIALKQAKALNQLLAHWVSGADRPSHAEHHYLVQLFKQKDPLMPAWTKINERLLATLPPTREPRSFSEYVWLALDDGTVRRGQYLNRIPTEACDTYVHDWFVESDDGGSASLNCPEFQGARPMAWAALDKPEHPGAL